MDRSKNVAAFVGSFDPVTLGHLDIIARAASLFSTLHVGIGSSFNKKYFFSHEERFEMTRAACTQFKNVHVQEYSGLTIHFLKSIKTQVLVRGLRSSADFEIESKIALMNAHLDKTVETVLLVSKPEFAHVSSTLIREIAQHRGSLEHLVPDIVIESFSQKIR